MTTPRTNLLLATFTLWQREIVRFLRQRNRVIGALGTPLVFWLLLGTGLNDAFVLGDPATSAPATSATVPTTSPAGGDAADTLGYRAYFFPGILVLIVLFTAIFSTISVIEDRREGFLQGVLASPAPRLAIVMGKVLGGATLATLQAGLFALIWLWVSPGTAAAALAQVAIALPVIFVLGLGLTALGFCLAWPMDSTAGFHAVMNLLLMPMWFLCGAVFPLATAPAPLAAVMLANPLTYGYSVLARVLHGPTASAAAGSLPLTTTLPVMAAAAVAAIALAWVVVASVRHVN
ncbi:MAG: ABC transporter permease [Phycisphaeraceae bacterium]